MSDLHTIWLTLPAAEFRAVLEPKNAVDNGLRLEDEGFAELIIGAASQAWFKPDRPEAVTATAD
jgi:hypothetical protein